MVAIKWHYITNLDTSWPVGWRTVNSSSSRSAGDVAKSVFPLCTPLLLRTSFLPLRTAHSIEMFQIATALSGSDMSPLIKRSRSVTKSAQSQYTYAMSSTQLTKAYHIVGNFHRAKFSWFSWTEPHQQKCKPQNFWKSGYEMSRLAIHENFTGEIRPICKNLAPTKITHYCRTGNLCGQQIFTIFVVVVEPQN